MQHSGSLLRRGWCGHGLCKKCQALQHPQVAARAGALLKLAIQCDHPAHPSVLTNTVAQIFDCIPDRLASDVRSELEQLLATSPHLVEGCITCSP